MTVLQPDFIGEMELGMVPPNTCSIYKFNFTFFRHLRKNPDDQYIKGGAWCNDQDSCEYRYQSSIDLMSSSQWTPSIYMTEGLFSQLPANNSWYNANSVYVMYCSSDVWSGNGSATYPDGTHYEFRGKVIIQALINLLWNSYGMDQATEVIDRSSFSFNFLLLIRPFSHLRSFYTKIYNTNPNMLHNLLIYFSGRFYSVDAVLGDKELL